MEEGEKCNDGLASSDISLEKPLHTDITLHVFEYFKESDFLMIGKCKRESRYSFFDTFSIEGDSSYMSDTGFLDNFFALESPVLELKEFFIREFVLG